MRVTSKTRRTLAALGRWGVEAEERDAGRYDRIIKTDTHTIVEHVDESRPWVRMCTILKPDGSVPGILY